MTSEQLQRVRAERWRQVENPLLTAEEARGWVEGIGLCLFAPRRAQFAAAAPSLVEAAAGTVTDAPTRETTGRATALMKRLAAESALAPLNLTGAAGSFVAAGASGMAGGFGVGFGGADVPDFVASRDVLPYVFSLIGGRNWKSGPGGKASPLMAEVWTLLGREGALTAAEMQTALGREVTETAALRALSELWHGLRVIPVYDGEVTRWELTQARFEAEMTASQKVAQTTALSALVSLYLGSMVAASSEEIETFLSPLTARSRVREVVNGLQATRQLEIVSVGAHPLLHVTGPLPEFAEAEESQQASELTSQRVSESEVQQVSKSASQRQHETGKGQQSFRERRDRESGFTRRESEERRPFREKREGRGERRPFEKKPFEKKPYERKPFGKRPFEKKRFEERGAEREGGFARKDREERRLFREKREGRGERRPFEKKPFEKKPYERKPFGKRPFEKKRFEERGGAEREGFGKKRFGARGEERGKRPFFRDRPDRERSEREHAEKGGERPLRRGEFGAERREGGWKSKPGGFAKSGKSGFKSAGKSGFKKPGFGKPAFGKPGSGKPGTSREGKTFSKTGRSFGKPGKMFGKGRPKPGGFGPPRKRKEKERGDAE